VHYLEDLKIGVCSLKMFIHFSDVYYDYYVLVYICTYINILFFFMFIIIIRVTVLLLLFSRFCFITHINPSPSYYRRRRGGSHMILLNIHFNPPPQGRLSVSYWSEADDHINCIIRPRPTLSAICRHR